MKPDNEQETQGTSAAADAEATRELLRIRQLSSRVAEATDAFTRMEFEEILVRAPAALQSLVGNVSLQIIREQGPGGGKAPAYSEPFQLPGGALNFESHYVGPPEPVRFVAYGFDDDPDAGLLLPLFLERLQRALQHAGFTAELTRQSRRDWLTGLQWRNRLEDTLQKLNPIWSAMALYVLRIPAHTDMENDPQWQLELRSFAQALRLALSDEDHAFQLDRTTVAILTKERDLARIEATVSRLAPEARKAYALSPDYS